MVLAETWGSVNETPQPVAFEEGRAEGGRAPEYFQMSRDARSTRNLQA